MVQSLISITAIKHIAGGDKLVPISSAPSRQRLTDLEITCKQKMLVPHIHNPRRFLNYFK